MKAKAAGLFDHGSDYHLPPTWVKHMAERASLVRDAGQKFFWMGASPAEADARAGEAVQRVRMTMAERGERGGEQSAALAGEWSEELGRARMTMAERGGRGAAQNAALAGEWSEELGRARTPVHGPREHNSGWRRATRDAPDGHAALVEWPGLLEAEMTMHVLVVKQPGGLGRPADQLATCRAGASSKSPCRLCRRSRISSRVGSTPVTVPVSHRMAWKEVGPDTLSEVDPESGGKRNFCMQTCVGEGRAQSSVGRVGLCTHLCSPRRRGAAVRPTKTRPSHTKTSRALGTFREKFRWCVLFWTDRRCYIAATTFVEIFTSTQYLLW